MRRLPSSRWVFTVRALGGRRAAALSGILAALAWATPARPQVTDAERSAARELFKEGDALQRAGNFALALDKFQRAERAYGAPTNVLRIAECQAALGQLVESAESYRAAIRTPLPTGSSPAFQAAIDQAKAELAQVEPRVPRLIVQVAPATAEGVLMQIDGQNVSASLMGVPIPLDPGTHRVRVVAQGFSSSEQDAALKEHETTTALATLRPSIASAPPSPPPAFSAAPSPPAQPTPNPPSSTAPGAPPPYPPPPPPAIADKEAVQAPRPSRTGLLLGGHIGWELAGGKLPLGGSTVDSNVVASGGAAYALDAGLRLARQWYVGLVLEHAELGHGDLSSLSGISDAGSSTTLLELVLAFIGNPDRLSFYGEIGAGTRWFAFTETGAGGQVSTSYNAGELTLGAGIWVPVGSALRLLPMVSIGLGTFDPPTGPGSAEGHSFAMIGLAGFYNIDF